MAWNNITVSVADDEFPSHCDGDLFSIPFSSGLKVGDSFRAGGKEHKVTSIDNIAGRDETILVNTIEVVKNDKSKKGRNNDKSSKSGVSLQNNNGRNDAN